MNLSIFLEQIPDGDGTWLQSLMSGLGWTLATAFFAWIIAFSAGSAVGVARTTDRRWLVFLGNGYVELFRNVPLLVQFFIWYFVVPGLFLPVKAWVTTLDPTQHQFVTAVVCLGLFTSARIAEQVRSGIQSLPRGQRSAGYALGLSQRQTYRYVLLPMAYRIIIPPLTSQYLNLTKNSTLAVAIGYPDLVQIFTGTVLNQTGQAVEVVAITMAVYLTISLVTSLLMNLYNSRIALVER